MLVEQTIKPASFHIAPSAMVLGEIFDPSTSVAVWQRPSNRLVSAYFTAVSQSLRLGMRNVLSMSSLKGELDNRFPDALGKEQAIEDVYLLADMLTCLFDCSDVGLRLVTIDKAMCPRLHVDNIPVRLITTYVGPGTEWLPNEFAECGENKIRQMNTFDAALLKGSAWGEEHSPAIHRSCDLHKGQQRIVMTLDPI